MVINIIWTIGTALCIAGLLVGAYLAFMETVIGSFTQKARVTLGRTSVSLVKGDKQVSNVNAGTVGERLAIIATQAPDFVDKSSVNVLAA